MLLLIISRRHRACLCLAGVENAPFPVLSSCFNKEVDLATCSKRGSTEERWRIKRWNLSRLSFFYSHSLCHCDSMCVCMYIHAVFKCSMCSILEQIQCFTQFWTSITQTRQVPSPQIFWPQPGTHVSKHNLGRLHHFLWIVVEFQEIHTSKTCLFSHTPILLLDYTSSWPIKMHKSTDKKQSLQRTVLPRVIHFYYEC